MPKVATCLLINNKGKILILKRSNKVRTYRGLWGGIAGYVEENEEPYVTAIKEIKEEVGINEEDINLVRQLEPIFFTDFYDEIKYDWEIYPFLFKIDKTFQINTDWEHTDFRWILPSEIINFNTVPLFKEIISDIFDLK
jgi:8-oxo-dGTP pyrophosphatase MutT (NUDIX family)